MASFFISRVDTEVDKRLAALPDVAGTDLKTRLHGQAAIANARLAYEVYEEAAASKRWQALASHGASLQRLLWASHRSEGQGLPSNPFCHRIGGSRHGHTMPEATLKAVGSLEAAAPDTISDRYAEAHTVVEELMTLGIDLTDVADVLEREGIASFVQSWEDLISSVETQLKNAGAEVLPAGAVKPASGESGASTAPAAAAPSDSAQSAQA